MSLLQRKCYEFEPDRAYAEFAARWATLCCVLTRKCRLDTSAGADYSTTGYSKIYYGHRIVPLLYLSGRIEMTVDRAAGFHP
ncbi:MAG TPA: hypothetical protein PLP19_13825 [bacterium]|nr:hypothetical protein [bacterium]HPN44566.1 hypothetical protein [bacterium]